MLQLSEPEISASATGRQTVEPARQSARLLGPARRALAPLERIRLDRREPERMVSTASLEQVQSSTHLEAQSPSFASPTRELRVERFQSLDRTARCTRSLRPTAHAPSRNECEPTQENSRGRAE